MRRQLQSARCSSGPLALMLMSILALLPQVAAACSVCFGDSDSDMAKGLNAGVLVLLIVVSVVLSGFAAFFVFVARRSARSGSK